MRVYALRHDLSWIKSHYGSSEACFWLSTRSSNLNSFGASSNSSCGCTKSETGRYGLFKTSPHQYWWEIFMEETFTALRDKPCKETVKFSAEKTVQTVKVRGCQTCSPKITECMRDFLDLFTRKIEETVSQVSCIGHGDSLWSLTGFVIDRVGVEVLTKWNC
jgi:hypothetical protein